MEGEVDVFVADVPVGLLTVELGREDWDELLWVEEVNEEFATEDVEDDDD